MRLFQKMKKFLKKCISMITLSFSKVHKLPQCEQRLFLFPKGVSLVVWYVSKRPVPSLASSYCSCLRLFTLCFLVTHWFFSRPGWNTWFYDCILNMLLLKSEFETDPSPTLSSFSCAVTRNLATSENVEFTPQ